LDRLRDLVSVGAIDRIYVHSPDRLARNYAYQVLLLDEWQRRGIEVVFLNRPLGKSPDIAMCLSVKAAVKRDSSQLPSKHELSSRSSLGSDMTAAALQKSAVAFRSRYTDRHRQANLVP
jgi:site-specific DNA recombinase